MSRTVIRLATCAHCGKELPPPKPRGRPRRYCSDQCRWAAKEEREQPAGWHAGETLASIPPDPLTLQRRTLELLAQHLDGAQPAPPEEQLLQALKETHQLVWVYRRLASEVHVNLQGRTAGLAHDIAGALADRFPGVE